MQTIQKGIELEPLFLYCSHVQRSMLSSMHNVNIDCEWSRKSNESKLNPCVLRAKPNNPFFFLAQAIFIAIE